MRFALGVLFGALLCVLSTASPATHLHKQDVHAELTAKVKVVQTVAPHGDVQPQPEKQAVAAATPAPQPVLTEHEKWMQAAGIAQSDWNYVDFIMSHESGWCQHKWEGEVGYCPDGYAETYSEENASRGYGLCQSTPAIKMDATAADWRDNPVTQLKWCDAYAKSPRYGSWEVAYSYWAVHRNW